MSDPLFHGGDVAVSWLITGETRPYNTVGGYFKASCQPRRLFSVGRERGRRCCDSRTATYTDGPVQGGTFWRITPMVNWYLTDIRRLEIAYGYGTLDRFDLKGVTQFFQTRLQLEF